MKFPVSILCVDDDPTNLNILSRHLSNCVDNIFFAADGREGHAMFLEKRPDIVLTDLMMPIVDGLEMSRMIRSSKPRIPIILLTSCNSAVFLEEAIDIGITQYLPKPVLKEKLMTSVQRCYETIDLERRLKEEHERAEAQLLRTIKLESLGVLAGGVAHNFNNILTAIIGNVALALMKLEEDSPAVKYLKNIEISSLRAAEIAKQMLEYSGKGSLMIEQINLNTLLQSMHDMLEALVPDPIDKIFEPSDPIRLINGDKSQIRQVVRSLVANAVEAINEGEGTIRIATGCMVCSKKYLSTCWFEEGVTEGEYVFLEVSDTGCGMDKETLAKLFDPFFSTKFTGRGLGMAAVMGIVKWHKGAIQITSQPGVGSTFRILLPTIAESETALTGDNRA